MLKLENLRFAWQQTMFEFNMDIEPQSLVAIIGPSGAGKSTLLDLIAGFIAPTSGSVSWNGQPLTHLPPGERPVSMVFQENNLFAHLNLFTNIGLGISPKLKLSAANKTTISAALERVDLAGFETRLPHQLSGGQRQRAALARALVRDKPVLLLDEPFAALGPALRASMLDLIKDLHAEKNLTTLMVSHQPQDAKTAATHTAFIDNGKVEIFQPTKKFFAIKDNAALTGYQGNS